ncbi:MAG: this family protein [Olpidium bornovanus]|uniref:This family protein n=1 Tax=Olpidium bornovanus TaxID=278681 RepID=A0A8H7ZPS6_9FUNG|nr:MAG: this family protein [Olpidium bornovanus]
MAAGDLARVLRERFPGLGPVLDTAALAVNMEYAGPAAAAGSPAGGEGLRIRPGDEVAVIPPVSGG